MDYFSGVSEAIKKASAAFTRRSRRLECAQNIAGQAPAGATATNRRKLLRSHA